MDESELKKWISELPKDVQRKKIHIQVVDKIARKLSPDAVGCAYSITRNGRFEHSDIILTKDASRLAFYHEVAHVLGFHTEQEANKWALEHIEPEQRKYEFEATFHVFERINEDLQKRLDERAEEERKRKAELEASGKRECVACRQVKNLEEFPKSKYGYFYACTPCYEKNQERKKQWKQKQKQLEAEGKRECVICHQIKSIEEFRRDNYLGNRCISCFQKLEDYQERKRERETKTLVFQTIRKPNTFN